MAKIAKIYPTWSSKLFFNSSGTLLSSSSFSFPITMRIIMLNALDAVKCIEWSPEILNSNSHESAHQHIIAVKHSLTRSHMLWREMKFRFATITIDRTGGTFICSWAVTVSNSALRASIQHRQQLPQSAFLPLHSPNDRPDKLTIMLKCRRDLFTRRR